MDLKKKKIEDSIILEKRVFENFFGPQLEEQKQKQKQKEKEEDEEKQKQLEEYKEKKRDEKEN